MATAAEIETFQSVFEALAGKAHHAVTTEDACKILETIFESEKPATVAIAALSDELTDQITELCTEKNISVIKPPYPSSELPNLIDTVDIGITGCAFGIAETGTLAEVALDDAIRLVSSLPRTHIGILYASDLVGTLLESSTALRHIFDEHPAGVAVSYLSGPSRTGDIEMKLTLGVHGPEKAYAVLLGEAS